MSEEKIWTCDCGCTTKGVNNKREGWLVLDQLPRGSDGLLPKNLPKLNRVLHFKTLSCLLKWATKAIRATEKMLKLAEVTASRGDNRGDYEDKKVEGLFI